MTERGTELPIERESPGIAVDSERAERLASLLTLSYEPMFAWHLDGAIEFWNSGAQRLYGFAPDEAVGRTSHALLQTRFPTDFIRLRAHLLNQRRWSGELRHVCKDGREVIVDSRMQLLDDNVVLEANRDVTSVAIYRSVFNQSGIFAGITDLQGRLLDANEMSLQRCGYKREQVLDRPFWDTPWWRGAEDVKAKIRLATQQAAAGQVFREELRYWWADGSEHIVDFTMYPIRDRANAVTFLHPTGIDLTERKQVEDDLREREQRLRYLAAIVESSDDAIVSKNLDGIITSWNNGAEQLFGFTAAEAIGQPITIVIPEDRLGEERNILTRIRRGERIDHFETVRRRKNGTMIVASLTVSPVKNAEGKVVGASKIARDVTEQKRIREHVATLAHEAEHRTKNILANVQAAVHLSQSDTPDGLKQAIEGRIQALANVHSLFVGTRWIGAELSAIASHELAPYSQGDEQRVRISGPPVLLEPNDAQAIAIALHELATNAAKYGALSVAGGQVDLMWSHEVEGRLTLRWSETGGPAVQVPTRKGFGRRIIDQMIDQRRGKTEFDWRADGLVCEISLQS